jgi:hypothetical protein
VSEGERERGRDRQSSVSGREGERQSGVAVPDTQEVPAAHGLVRLLELFEREQERVRVCV